MEAAKAAELEVVMASSFEAFERRRMQNELLDAIEIAVRMAEELSWPPQPI